MPSPPMAGCAAIPDRRWTAEEHLAKDQCRADVRSQLNELTTRTEALLDRHATTLLASQGEVLTAIKEQAGHAIVVKETVDRLMNREHSGLSVFVERAGVLLKAAQEPRNEDPGVQKERLQRYLDEMMSLNDRMLSIAVEDLTSDGTQVQSLCPDEIAIPRDVVHFGNLIGKLTLRCQAGDDWLMGRRLTSFHDRWCADLKKPDALAELQEDFRVLCAAIRTAESPRLLGLSWTGLGPYRGIAALTIASAPQQPADRQARA